MPTSYLSPGVYIEEVDRGTKPIEAVGTSTCAFIGESSVGPTNEAVLITNWAQFTRTFGDFQHSTHLAHAVYGFFNNGGTKAFVCNVSPKTVTAEQAAKEAEKKEADASWVAASACASGTSTSSISSVHPPAASAPGSWGWRRSHRASWLRPQRSEASGGTWKRSERAFELWSSGKAIHPTRAPPP